MALLFKFIWSSTLNCSWPSDFITLLFPGSYKIYFFFISMDTQLKVSANSVILNYFQILCLGTVYSFQLRSFSKLS